ncbi:MAG: FAD-binding protein [Spirochaetaceae bacterium]|jgi:flavin-dependent dehydrogenase|nr:FAD-binding protein [Spirochaetaceae bacterium]
MYDIAIIGLGPGGATLARLLDRKLRVIGIDRKSLERGKCCGGLLSPSAQRMLARNTICLPNEVLADPQIFSVKTIDLDNCIERSYQRFYINMNRAKFDNFLISLIPDTVELRRSSLCKSVTWEQGAYRLVVKTKEAEETVEARTLIGADGANSIVRNTFYPKKRIHRYMAIQEWYEDQVNPPGYCCIFDREVTDSYCWTIAKDRCLVIGGAFPVKDSGRRFAMLKERVQNRGLYVGKLLKREGCFVYLNKGFGMCTGGNGAYLIGEAAGMISPSSLEGISYALESAEKLAEVINRSLDNIGPRYFMKTAGMRIKLLGKMLKMPFMYNRFLRKLVMKSGIEAI